MPLTLAGRNISSPESLSPLTRLVLAFIDGGTEWVRWAVDNPASVYGFADETQLVDGVQQGLHVSNLVILPKLGVAIGASKLMSLGLPDLQLIGQAEGGDDSALTQARVRQIWSSHSVSTNADVGAVEALLVKLGVNTATVFSTMDFNDRLSLMDLLRPTAELAPSSSDQTSEPSIEGEAAAFAVEQSRTPLEFKDYYRFYLDCFAKFGADTSKAQRATRANTALETLLTIGFGALDCPRVDGLLGPSAIARVVADWLAQGRQLGFARLSLVVQQVMKNSPFRDEQGADATKIVQRYLQSAQAFIAGKSVRRSMLGQDGASASITFESESLRAVLLLGSNGVLSLREFGMAEPLPTHVASSPTITTTATESAS